MPNAARVFVSQVDDSEAVRFPWIEEFRLAFKAEHQSSVKQVRLPSNRSQNNAYTKTTLSHTLILRLNRWPWTVAWPKVGRAMAIAPGSSSTAGSLVAPARENMDFYLHKSFYIEQRLDVS